MESDDLARLSDRLAALVAEAGGLVIGVRAGGQRHISGILWRDGAVVTSEQALPEAPGYTAVMPGGEEKQASLAGRDCGTNVAVLRVDAATAPKSERATAAAAGELAIALGSDGAGGSVSRLAMIHRAGPPWNSMAGGRIDHLLVLDVRLSSTEEGGPVMDARGRLLGMSTFGPRRRTLVIPHETIERVLEPLLAQGRVARGWLGVALQPVALPEAVRDLAGCPAGLMVMSLSTGGPAEQAGVLQGDILLAMDGELIASPRQLSQRLGAERVGQECALRVLRAGMIQEVRAVVGARP